MKIKIYTRNNCKWCERAKDLLDDLGLRYDSLQVQDIVDLRRELASDSLPTFADTVPQIVIDGELVGGYDKLEVWVREVYPNLPKIYPSEPPIFNLADVDIEHTDMSKWAVPYDSGLTIISRIGEDSTYIDGSVLKSAAPAKRKTVFNANNTGHETGDYPLFMGEELGLVDTINDPYPILDAYYQAQLSQIWNEFEVDLTQDRQDMINANPDIVALMVKTILWQHLADSIASRSITGILMEHVSNSNLEAWYNCVALFETIHARTYSHIIKQTFVDPVQALREGYSDLEVIRRSDILKNCFDDVANMPANVSQEEKEEKVYLAVVALYLLETLNFMASFAITFGVAEANSVFQGIVQDVTFICRDEILHGLAGGEVLKIEMARKPEVFARLKPQIQALFDSIVSTELEWTDYLFSEGRQSFGVNPRGIKDYVIFRAQDPAKLLGLNYTKMDSNPLPYMENYTNSGKVQVAPQEMQLTSYLVNAVTPVSDMPSLLNRLKDKYVD